MTDTTLVAEPIRAWKVARIALVPDPDDHLPGRYSPRLVPMTARDLVEFDATAVCRPGTAGPTVDHDAAPHPGCRCGFYALPERRPPRLPGLGPGTQVAVAVEISGRVVSHANPNTADGIIYRAARQRVVAIEVPRLCADCTVAARFLTFTRPTALDPTFGGIPASLVYGEEARPPVRVLATTCGDHGERSDGRLDRLLRPGDLSGLLGVDVAWTDDYDPGMFGVSAAALGAAFGAASQFVEAMNRAMVAISTDLTSAAESMRSIAEQIGRADPPDDAEDHRRREGESPLDYKRRRDAARAARLDRLDGPNRPPRNARL